MQYTAGDIIEILHLKNGDGINDTLRVGNKYRVVESFNNAFHETLRLEDASPRGWANVTEEQVMLYKRSFKNKIKMFFSKE